MQHIVMITSIITIIISLFVFVFSYFSVVLLIFVKSIMRICLFFFFSKNNVILYFSSRLNIWCRNPFAVNLFSVTLNTRSSVCSLALVQIMLHMNTIRIRLHAEFKCHKTIIEYWKCTSHTHFEFCLLMT